MALKLLFFLLLHSLPQSLSDTQALTQINFEHCIANFGDGVEELH